MKKKKLIYICVIIGLIVLSIASILFIFGFRLSSMQAARTSFNLNSEYVDSIDYKKGKVYLFKNKNSYQTIVTEKKLILWKSSSSFSINRNNDKIRLIGWCSLNDLDASVTIIHVESIDKSVSYIEMGTDDSRIRKYTIGEKPLVFFWNTSLTWNDLNGIAYSKNNKPLYKLGYQISRTAINPKTICWLPVNN